MDNGSALTFPQFSGINLRHKAGTVIGLGNRRSVRLSYEAHGSFPRFPPLTGQGAPTQTRQAQPSVSAHRVAHLDHGLFWRN